CSPTTLPGTTGSKASGCPERSFPQSPKSGDDTPRTPTADPTPATPSARHSAGTRSHPASAVETDTPGRPPRSKTGPPVPTGLADSPTRPKTLQVVAT